MSNEQTHEDKQEQNPEHERVYRPSLSKKELEPSPEVWENYEEIKHLLVLNDIVKIWTEKDTHTFEDLEVRQFTKEFRAFMVAVKKKTCKSWGKMEASERSGFITLVMLGWLNSRNKQFLADHFLWPMVECVVLWIEELWVENNVEPKKRDAVLVERCCQHSWCHGPNIMEDHYDKPKEEL